MSEQSTILCLSSHEKGQEFLRQCKRSGWRVLLITVEKLAINAVMAGCLPEYMPVLVAMAEALADPAAANAPVPVAPPAILPAHV